MHEQEVGRTGDNIADAERAVFLRRELLVAVPVEVADELEVREHGALPVRGRRGRGVGVLLRGRRVRVGAATAEQQTHQGNGGDAH